MPSSILEVEGLSKSYGTVRALDDVSLEFAQGEIHGVLGENGAGKSTLVGILGGFIAPDSGRISMNGAKLTLGKPFEARSRGIEMVHQHFTLVPEFSVAENLALSSLKGLFKSASTDSLSESALALGKELGWSMDPRARTGDLPVGVQQRLEILKALSGRAEVLILDEPTAVLSPSEVSDLFNVLRKLKEAGKTVILIAHKLSEVLGVADRVTVLRRGKWIATAQASDIDAQTLAKWMVGEMPPLLSKGTPRGGQPAVVASGLVVKGNRGEFAVRGVSFHVSRGEVFGIGGVDGNGQIELAEALAKVRKPSEGTIAWPKVADIEGALSPESVIQEAHPTIQAPDQSKIPANPASKIENPKWDSSGHSPTASPREHSQSEIQNSKSRILHGPRPSDRRVTRHASPVTRIGYIPQDRQNDGLALRMSILDNLLIQGHRKHALCWGPVLLPRRIRDWAQRLVRIFKIVVGSLDDPVASLSGGNQQKVVVARTLESEPSLLVAVNPTRGLDLQATNYVHKELLSAKARGAAVILLSTDLDELDQLADRTVFMNRGAFMEGQDAAAYVGDGG